MTKQMVTIQETSAAMQEVMFGSMPAHPLLAAWASALSLKMKLPLNCKYVRLLVDNGYLFNGLPENQDDLLDALGRKPGQKTPQGIMRQHVNTLYAVEKIYQAGLLDLNAGNTLTEQQAWREKMIVLLPGMGSKLVSWMLFIYNPFNCKLLTIDSWHCNRLGIDQKTLAGKSKKARFVYLETEARMLAEAQALHPDYAPVVVQAMLWENARIAGNMSDGQGYTSHKGISCRWY